MSEIASTLLQQRVPLSLIALNKGNNTASTPFYVWELSVSVWITALHQSIPSQHHSMTPGMLSDG